MKKFLCSLVAVLLLGSFLCACGKTEYEFSRGSYDGEEIVLCLSVDPFDTKPGTVTQCTCYEYSNDELVLSFPATVTATWSASDTTSATASEDGVTYAISLDSVGWVVYRYNFDTNKWETNS